MHASHASSASAQGPRRRSATCCTWGGWGQGRDRERSETKSGMGVCGVDGVGGRREDGTEGRRWATGGRRRDRRCRGKDREGRRVRNARAVPGCVIAIHIRPSTLARHRSGGRVVYILCSLSSAPRTTYLILPHRVRLSQRDAGAPEQQRGRQAAHHAAHHAPRREVRGCRGCRGGRTSRAVHRRQCTPP